jgi:ABC-2 type transport system permease protein
MFRVEMGKAVRRARTWVLAAGLAALAILPVVILATTSPASSQGGPPFFDLIRHSGMVAALAAITIIEPFFLPLGTGLLSGESISSEAANGTLRYLVARPVGRTRLVLSKYAAVMVQVAAAIGWVCVVGLAAGVIAFGAGPLPTLSGTTIAFAPGLVRVLASASYVLLDMAGLAAVGLFFSTLTDSVPSAIFATVSVGIASQILDNISAVHAIHPYLPSHQWLAFVDLFRFPVAFAAMRQGLVLDAAYTAVFLGLAVWVFGRKDVVS